MGLTGCDGTDRLKWDLEAKMGLADFGVTSCIQVTLQPASISQFLMALAGCNGAWRQRWDSGKL
jgi:hypothetical protein